MANDFHTVAKIQWDPIHIDAVRNQASLEGLVAYKF